MYQYFPTLPEDSPVLPVGDSQIGLYRKPRLSISFLKLRTRFPFNRPLHIGLSFVIHLFSACDSNFDLDPSILKVYLSWNQRHALSGYCLVELGDLTLVKQ